MEEGAIRPGVQVELEPADRDKWVALSRAAKRAAAGMNPTRHNADLEAEANGGMRSAAAPAYLLWSAENIMRAGRITDALDAFNTTIDAGDQAPPLVEGMDFIAAALHHKAEAAAQSLQIDLAISTYRELSDRAANPAEALFEAGRAAGSARLFDQAVQLYEEAANMPARGRADDPTEDARRAVDRLTDQRSYFSPSLAGLANHLSESLEDRDGIRLESLASRTHFAVGVGAAHLVFDNLDVIAHMTRELEVSRPEQVGALLGTGGKRYLFTKGWKGEWFRGRVAFLLVRSGRGWQWSGVVLSQATDPWFQRWKPDSVQTNQPLTLEIGAPWPAGRKFKAGGLKEYLARTASIEAADAASLFGLIGGSLFGTPFGFLGGSGISALIEEAYSVTDCGFGLRGFYYNAIASHNGADAFAIDFSTYRRGVPYDNESGGTPVLAAAEGIVTSACGGITSGDATASNVVELLHADPVTGTQRYLSRYLHLAGPSQVLVSMGMHVERGDRLGLMNDTGTSVIDHLHFSIHDQTMPFPGAGTSCGSTIPRGSSVRPTPMDGQSLDDDDDGKCVLSRNVERGSIRSSEGRITFLRVHEIDTGFGPREDFVDAEVIVQIDSAPGESFGLQLREGQTYAASRAMFDIVRNAFADDARVRLEYERIGPTGRAILRTMRTS